jgi:WD40 repeat protein
VARIFCQVLHRADRITFLWSERAASFESYQPFEPYHLEGAERANLLQVAAQIHAKMATGGASEIASLGHQLYRAVFRQDSSDYGSAEAVRTWLAKAIATDTVEKLEFLSDSPGLIPFNLLLDEISAGKEKPRFWGTRFNLGAGRRINALRQNPTQINPTQFCAADLDLTAADPLLRDASALVHTTAALVDGLAKGAPDVFLLMVRFANGRLRLGADSFTVADLHAWLAAPQDGNPDPLVIVAASGESADQVVWQKTLADASAAFSGLVANETLLPGTKAFEVGRAIAQRFAEGKQNIGEILRTLRNEREAAWSFSAFCPPQLRVVTEGAADAPSAELPIDILPLPLLPYRPFAAFEAADRPLLFAREEDVLRGALATDQPDTGFLLLHGSPAVGKTSYLQAGLLPYLEQECVGYRVLRDRLPTETPTAEKDYPILILRCSHDLAGQFADALSVFCAQPLTYATPDGRPVTVDLPALLQQAVVGANVESTAIQQAPANTSMTATPGPDDDTEREPMSARDLWVALRDNKETLGRVLDAITRPLPFELVIAVDLGEELLTQVRTPQQKERRQKALDMLTSLSNIAPRCKIVYTIRTQSLGQFVSLFSDGRMPADFRPFYLRPLTEPELVGALSWPTDRAEIPYSDEIPFQKYGFSYEDGLAQQIVTEALDASATTQQAPLPMIHAAGELLYEIIVQEKTQPTLHAGDLKQLGGVKGSLDKYLDRKLDRLALSKPARKALRDLIGKLYTGHADGTVSAELLLATDLGNYWTYQAEPGAPIVNQAAQEQGLFEIQELLIGGQPSVFISLPQDSLAQLGRKIAGETEQQALAWTRAVDMLWIMIPLIFLAAAVTFWGTRHYESQKFEVERTKLKSQDEEFTEKVRAAFKEQDAVFRNALRETRPQQYVGLMAQADQALRTDNALRARFLLKSEPAMLSMSDDKKKYPDLRGFEWHYLWRYLNSERFRLEGHTGVIHAVAISRDSKWAASVGNARATNQDSAIRVWNLQTGELLAMMPGHRTTTLAVAFSPDNKTLATGGVDNVVRLWDLTDLKNDFVEITKEPIVLKGHSAAVQTLAFGKDSNTLASAGADKTIILWDIKADKNKPLPTEHNDVIRALAFTDDGKTLVSAGAESAFVVWDAEAGTKRQTVKTPYQTIAGLTISSDGKTLCTAGVETRLDAESGVLRFWTLPDGKETHKAIQHGTGILSVAFAPDGKSVASGGKDRVIRLFNVETGKERQKWIGHLAYVSALAFARDGSALVAGDLDQTVKVWNPAQSSGPETIAAHGDWVQALALNRKNTLLASGSRDGTVKLWDPKTGNHVKDMPVHKGAVTSLAFSFHKDTEKTKDMILLAVGTRDDKNEGEIKVWQIDREGETGYKFKELHTFKEHPKGVTCLAFSPSDEKPDLLVSGSADHTVKVWNTATGKLVTSHHGHKDEVRCVAFADDGRSFASGGKDALLCLYDLDSKDIRTLADLHANSIESIVLFSLVGNSPDGIRETFTGVLSGSADQTVKIHKEPSARDLILKDKPLERATYRSHSQPVTSVLYQEVKRPLIVSASWDGSIKLYDTSSERFTFIGHQGAVRAIVMAADQSFLASAGNDGTIRIWRAFVERPAEKMKVEKK